MPEYRLQRFRDGWAFSVYDQGQRITRRRLQADNEAEARRELDRIVAELDKPSRVTVETIWDAYREDRVGRPIAVTMGFERKAIVAHFGNLDPVEITTKTCRIYIAKRRAAGRKDGTIGTELGHLRGALQWAVKREIIAKAPFIELPPRPAPKDRHLTRAEVERLLQHADWPHLRLWIILAVATAARLTALLELTWDRCDFERGLIYLHDPDVIGLRKGRAVVPMNATARAALLEAREGARTRFVIEWAGERLKKMRRSLNTAARRAGIEGVSPHVLRHTAAVWMAEAGVPMAEISQYMGHSSIRVTERVYARYSPTYLSKAAGALEIGGIKSERGFK